MSWVLALLGFIVLVILHEAGHFAVAKAVGMRVERFALFFPPLIARKKIGETEYAIGAIPAGGYVKITGMNPDQELPDEVRTRAYYAQPAWKRVAVIAAGPAVNFILAAVLLWVFVMVHGPQDVTNRIDTVEKKLPAAGKIVPGDRIVSVDGRRGGAARIQRAIRNHRCPGGARVAGCKASTPATVVIQRNGERRTLRLTPEYDPITKSMRLGYTYAIVNRPESAGDAIGTAASQYWFFTRETVKLPLRIFDSERRKEIGTAVGAYEVTRQTIEDDVGEAIGIIALISLSLAIINLFPFLPLDGGHIFWAIVEKVRRKPVPFSVMERASVFGFALVLMFFFVGLSNDIDRLTGEGFNTR
jgi:regulator of sigma E protease